MPKSRGLLAFAILGSIALVPVANASDPFRASICDHVAGNLVMNCGFETGNFSDWTVTPAASGKDIVVTFLSLHQ